MHTIRFIDPLFLRSNPSTNGLVDVALRMVENGWDVEIFGNEIDPDLIGKVTMRKIPRIWLPWNQSDWGYFLYYNSLAFRDWLMRKKLPSITVCTGFLLPSADIATVHFSHFDYVGKALRYGRGLPDFFKIMPFTIWGLMTEIILLWNPKRTLLLPVSKSVADDIKRFSAPWKRVELFPNAVLHGKFSPALRLEHRNAARNHHGFSASDTVFLFSSMGHHFRKGFFLAIHAMLELRKTRPEAKLLVIGGYASTLARLRRHLDDLDPNFGGWITMTGIVSDVAFHSSAADALLFPSLSEAFSLTEIEAAALGLPLFLTPHHGSEMILEDGVNGRLLAWEPVDIANVLDEEIGKGIEPTSGSTGLALSEDEYFNKFCHLVGLFADEKKANQS